LALFSRAFRSLGAPKLCDEQVRVKQRDRGFTAGQQVESLVLLHVAGGDCMQDIEPLRQDGGVTKMLGYAAPSERGVAEFLEALHDPETVAHARAQAQRHEQVSFIPEQTAALRGLGQVGRGAVRAIAGRAKQPETRATVDQDATILESYKREAQWTTFAKESDGTLRQWTDVDFVPGEKVEKKDIQSLRYVGLRLLKPQGDLFADGNDKRYHAILTNRWEEDGGDLITWHRAKAGTI